MKSIKAFASFLIILAAASFSLQAQEKDPVTLKNMLESKTFVFKARTAYPQTGSSRILTSEYDVKLSGDKIVSFLPYFGRAYSANPYANDGGIKFTSTDFSYVAKQTKKGWRVTIIPKDANAVQQLYLDVSGSGYATLQVTSADRQSISFHGVVEKSK
jgi:hypothetical protein